MSEMTITRPRQQVAASHSKEEPAPIRSVLLRLFTGLVGKMPADSSQLAPGHSEYRSVNNCELQEFDTALGVGRSSGMKCLALLAVLAGCSPDLPTSIEPTASTSKDPQIDSQVTAFCSACHVMPRADSFPKSAWPEEVKKGFDFYVQSGRTDLKPPAVQDVEEWFISRAPDRLSFKEEVVQDQRGFELSSLPWPAKTGLGAVSSLRSTGSDLAVDPLVICDMFTGDVSLCRKDGDQLRVEELCQVSCPCRATISDLDGDDVPDFVVADLGNLNPSDHSIGAVWWVYQDAKRNEYKKVRLLKHVGRVADVRPVDFDRDGDQDLIVAEFGLFKTGSIHLMTNIGTKHGLPQFEKCVIDERHGTMELLVTDLNGDGWMDFIALISQDYETVVAFINNQKGQFEKNVIFAADDPAFGSSGISLADMDRDGDTDVIHVNGDTMDSHRMKPYHAIRWLENAGSFPFIEHEIAKMPGVHRALATDFDGDGDLDVAAVSLLPFPQDEAAEPPIAVVWLEQTQPNVFQKFAISRDECRFASFELIDWDADGRMDIVTAGFAIDGKQQSELLLIKNLMKPAD